MTVYDIFVAFAVLFEGVVIHRYCQTLFVNRYSQKVTILFIAIGYILVYLCFLFAPPYINMLVFTTINVVVLCVLYNVNLIKSLFHALVVSAFLGGVEVLIYTFLGAITGYKYQLLNNPIVGATFTIFCKFAYFLCLEITAKLFRKRKDIVLKKSPGILGLLLAPTLTFLVYVLYFYILFEIELPITVSITILSICTFLLFFNALAFYYYNKTQFLYNQSIDMQITLNKEVANRELYQLMAEQEEIQHILIHDMRKHFSTLSSFAEQNEIEKLRLYLNELNHHSNVIGSVIFCNNNTLNLILNRYNSLFNKSGLAHNFIIAENTVDFLLDNEITSIFDNLLENAYEATKDLDDAYIDLTVRFDNKRESTVISLVNSCDIYPVIDSAGDFLTTKQDSFHGYGIKSINRIIANYSGDADFYKDIHEDTFHSVIIIPNTVEQLIT